MAGMPDSPTDFVTKLAVVVIGALIALGGWRTLHPATHFQVEGLDYNWDQAVGAAKLANQPTVVLVTADWCPTCQNLHANVLSRSDVRDELSRHYTFVKLDMSNPSDKQIQLAEKVNANSYPTLIRYDLDGKETAREHFLPPEQMIAWLRAGE